VYVTVLQGLLPRIVINIVMMVLGCLPAKTYWSVPMSIFLAVAAVAAFGFFSCFVCKFISYNASMGLL
jgi:hypothetical protein